MSFLPSALAARLASWGVHPGALVWQPPPPAGGDAARARRLARGVLLLDGRLVESNAPHPWDLAAPDRAWSDALHGHGWLDDAAAADDPEIWSRFDGWAWEWIDRHADGTGPGWRADLVARRLSRWIAYSLRLLRGRPPHRSRAFFRALAGHARYLGWRWSEIEGGARIEALCGLVYATISMEGDGRAAARAVRRLGREASAVIGTDGSIGSRNPEELARIAAMLAWSAEAISGAGLRPADGHLDAMRRAAPVIRALAMPDGTLTRFHGSRGRPGLPVPPATPLPVPAAADPRVMGYHRMAGGDSLLVLDAAAPPAGRHAATAHISALGFELWSGAQPVIVSAGSGLGFGRRDALAARRAGAHSTVEIAGSCPGRPRQDGRLTATGGVALRVRRTQGGHSALAESTLYAALLGLVVERRLQLSADGTRLEGEDTVLATTAEMRARAAALFPVHGRPGTVAARFHLHPDIRATLALSGRAVALTLPDGTRWLLHAGAESLTLEPSRYYDEGRARPRATMQVVATAPLVQYWARIGWRLERVGVADRTAAYPAGATAN
jgi:uncharacterized heparinase superfamily protein